MASPTNNIMDPKSLAGLWGHFGLQVASKPPSALSRAEGEQFKTLFTGGVSVLRQADDYYHAKAGRSIDERVPQSESKVLMDVTAVLNDCPGWLGSYPGFIDTLHRLWHIITENGVGHINAERSDLMDGIFNMLTKYLYKDKNGKTWKANRDDFRLIDDHNNITCDLLTDICHFLTSSLPTQSNISHFLKFWDNAFLLFAEEYYDTAMTQCKYIFAYHVNNQAKRADQVLFATDLNLMTMRRPDSVEYYEGKTRGMQKIVGEDGLKEVMRQAGGIRTQLDRAECLIQYLQQVRKWKAALAQTGKGDPNISVHELNSSSNLCDGTHPSGRFGTEVILQAGSEPCLLLVALPDSGVGDFGPLEYLEVYKKDVTGIAWSPNGLAVEISTLSHGPEHSLKLVFCELSSAEQVRATFQRDPTIDLLPLAIPAAHPTHHDGQSSLMPSTNWPLMHLWNYIVVSMNQMPPDDLSDEEKRTFEIDKVKIKAELRVVEAHLCHKIGKPIPEVLTTDRPITEVQALQAILTVLDMFPTYVSWYPACLPLLYRLWHIAVDTRTERLSPQREAIVNGVLRTLDEALHARSSRLGRDHFRIRDNRGKEIDFLKNISTFIGSPVASTSNISSAMQFFSHAVRVDPYGCTPTIPGRATLVIGEAAGGGKTADQLIFGADILTTWSYNFDVTSSLNKFWSEGFGNLELGRVLNTSCGWDQAIKAAKAIKTPMDRIEALLSQLRKLRNRTGVESNVVVGLKGAPSGLKAVAPILVAQHQPVAQMFLITLPEKNERYLENVEAEPLKLVSFEKGNIYNVKWSKSSPSMHFVSYEINKGQATHIKLTFDDQNGFERMAYIFGTSSSAAPPNDPRNRFESLDGGDAEDEPLDETPEGRYRAVIGTIAEDIRVASSAVMERDFPLSP